MCLKRLMSKLTKDALINCKKKRSPHLFRGKVSNHLDLDKERSEVIGLYGYGWAIFSSLKRFQKGGVANENARKLLGVVLIRLDEVDDNYFDKCYASSVSLLNDGGKIFQVLSSFHTG